MKIYLADLNQPLVEAWQAVFESHSDIIIHHGSIFDLETDAIVSPANSFGYMDGGIDLHLSNFLGWHVQEQLQEKIKSVHHGELLVGIAEIVATEHPQFPYLISAPTMRVPKILGSSSMNPYLAMRAILRLVLHGTFEDDKFIRDRVKSVAIPGLGTGVGQVPPNICAQQMYQATHDILWQKYQFPGSWVAALRNEEALTIPSKDWQ